MLFREIVMVRAISIITVSAVALLLAFEILIPQKAEAGYWDGRGKCPAGTTWQSGKCVKG